MAQTVIRNLLKVRYIVTLAIFLSCSAHAQQGKGYSVHANIIYHFTKYVDWPDNLKTGDFVIGVIAEPALYDELSKIAASKMVGAQRLVVKKFPAGAATYSCHILFVSDEESGEIKKIAAASANLPMLLVTESEGAARKGACINFAIIDDRLRLEINKNNIEKRDLHIATDLLQLGTVVK